jgi:hypothetical protein
MLTFVNHSSQAPDEKVLRTYPPGLGKITIVYFYLSTDVLKNKNNLTSKNIKCSIFILQKQFDNNKISNMFVFYSIKSNYSYFSVHS